MVSGRDCTSSVSCCAAFFYLSTGWSHGRPVRAKTIGVFGYQGKRGMEVSHGALCMCKCVLSRKFPEKDILSMGGRETPGVAKQR